MSGRSAIRWAAWVFECPHPEVDAIVDPLSIVCVVIGILIIATRGPMVFAPTATLRVFERLISTDARIRVSGVAVAPFAVALIALPLGEGAAVEVRALGWLWAGVTLWLLFAPGSYRRVVRGVLNFLENSVDEATVRIIGLVAVAIGVALIYFGIYVA